MSSCYPRALPGRSQPACRNESLGLGKAMVVSPQSSVCTHCICVTRRGSFLSRFFPQRQGQKSSNRTRGRCVQIGGLRKWRGQGQSGALGQYKKIPIGLAGFLERYPYINGEKQFLLEPLAACVLAARGGAVCFSLPWRWSHWAGFVRPH